MPLSTYAADNVLSHLLGVSAWTKPTNTYFSLHTADPGLIGSSEISAGWYARQLASWNAATNSGATNNGVHTFPTVTGSNVTVTHIGLWDALSGGNFLFSIDIADVVFAVGSSPKILDAAVTVTPGSAYHNDILASITNHLTGHTALNFDSSVYLALFTTTPSQSNNGTEVSTVGTAYARQQIEFDTPVSGATDNTNTEAFTTATSNLGTINGLGIMSGDMGTDFVLIGNLTTAQTVNLGDDYQAAAGDIDFTT